MRSAPGFLIPTGTLLSAGEVRVQVLDHLPGLGTPMIGPSYSCAITRRCDAHGVGMLVIRLATTELVERYIGHLGYGIDPPFRGHAYARQACLAAVPLLRAHQLDPVWITCDPDNRASRRTCEELGAELLEVVDTPAWTGLHRDGGQRKCRYRWRLPD